MQGAAQASDARMSGWQRCEGGGVAVPPHLPEANRSSRRRQSACGLRREKGPRSSSRAFHCLRER